MLGSATTMARVWAREWTTLRRLRARMNASPQLLDEPDAERIVIRLSVRCFNRRKDHADNTEDKNRWKEDETDQQKKRNGGHDAIDSD